MKLPVLPIIVLRYLKSAFWTQNLGSGIFAVLLRHPGGSRRCRAVVIDSRTELQDTNKSGLVTHPMDVIQEVQSIRLQKKTLRRAESRSLPHGASPDWNLKVVLPDLNLRSTLT